MTQWGLLLTPSNYRDDPHPWWCIMFVTSSYYRPFHWSHRHELHLGGDQRSIEVKATMSSSNKVALSWLESLYQPMLPMSQMYTLTERICCIWLAIPYLSRRAWLMYTSVTRNTSVIWINAMNMLGGKLGWLIFMINYHILAFMKANKWEVMWLYTS